jgi:hypothetical protein
MRTRTHKLPAFRGSLRTEPRITAKIPIFDAEFNLAHLFFNINRTFCALQHRIELGRCPNLHGKNRKILRLAFNPECMQLTNLFATSFAQFFIVPALLFRLYVNLSGGHEAALALEKDSLTPTLERLCYEFRRHVLAESFTVPATATGHAMRVIR